MIGPCLSYSGFLNPWGDMAKSSLKQIEINNYQLRYFSKL